jgi:hypothetical protein
MSNNTDILKQELTNLKTKLEEIELELENKSQEVTIREEKWKQMESQVNQIIDTKTDEIVKFNVGGKKFSIRKESLLKYKDTLFYKIAVSERFNFSQEIFFDRSTQFFPFILDYLRGNDFDYTRFSRDENEELLLEAEYYELTDVVEHLKEKMKEIEFVRFETNGVYTLSSVVVGTNKVEDLNDSIGNKGICAISPGWILIELNNEWEFDEIEVKGFCGNSTAWYAGNGSGAQIMTSIDKTTWKTVGTLPSNYGANVITVKLTKSSGRYIKFSGNSYVGIGYLKIKKIK